MCKYVKQAKNEINKSMLKFNNLNKFEKYYGTIEAFTIEINGKDEYVGYILEDENDYYSKSYFVSTYTEDEEEMEKDFTNMYQKFINVCL